jgi:fused signal recognition particle receptor
VFAAVDQPISVATHPQVTLIVGVNGTGKTTTVGKLANLLKRQGRTPLICAADTFRAAAVEQLAIWAMRAGVDMVRAREGADPAAVVFDAITSGKAKGRDPILIDTAGRLHTRVNPTRTADQTIAAREAAGAPCKRARSTRPSGRTVSQAREFMGVAGVNGIAPTKPMARRKAQQGWRRSRLEAADLPRRRRRRHDDPCCPRRPNTWTAC